VYYTGLYKCLQRHKYSRGIDTPVPAVDYFPGIGYIILDAPDTVWKNKLASEKQEIRTMKFSGDKIWKKRSGSYGKINEA
jgi:hypothetical protein